MKKSNFKMRAIALSAFIFIILFSVLSIGNNAFAGGVGAGCSVFYPCDKGLSCQPFVHKCYHNNY